MKLAELLPLLAPSTNLYVTLFDENNTKLIRFNAPGYTAIKGDLYNKTVTAFTIGDANQVSVTIEVGLSAGTPGETIEEG